MHPAAWDKRLAGMALCLLVVGASCNDPAPPPAPGKVVLDDESVASARLMTIETGPRVSGTLEAEARAIVRAEAGGTVLAAPVERGQRVRRGQLLARIDARSLTEAGASARAALATAEVQHQTARRNQQRARSLYQAGAVSRRDLETAEDQLAAAQAQRAQARANLAEARRQIGNTTVRAPMAGVVSERAVREGDVVSPGAALYTIIDLGSLRLDGQVPARALRQLRVGTQVAFEVRGYPGRSFTGTIARIAPATDPETGQIPILVTLKNPGGALVAGLYAEGRVLARQRETLVVPLAALDETGARDSVLRITGGTVERVPVETGIIDERAELVEITRGLELGDLVVLGQARTVAPGTAVRVARPEARNP